MTDFKPSTVDLVKRHRLADSYCKLDRLHLRHELYDGGMGPEITREVLERGHAAAAMLYDPKADACVLIEQFRPGAWAAGWEPWLLEVVAGIIEPGETPEDVIRREAVEESGCTIGRLEHICNYLVTPGISTETIALFVAEADSRTAGGLHGLAEEGEDIRTIVLPFTDLAPLLASGKMTNATAIIAAQWLLLHHDRLHTEWTDT